MIGKVRVRVEKKKGPGSGNRNVVKYGLETRWPSLKEGQKSRIVAGRVTEAEKIELSAVPGSMSDKVRAGLLLLLEEARSKGLLEEEEREESR